MYLEWTTGFRSYLRKVLTPKRYGLVKKTLATELQCIIFRVLENLAGRQPEVNFIKGSSFFNL